MSDNENTGENIGSEYATSESIGPDESSDNSTAPALKDAAKKSIDTGSIIDEFAQQFRQLISECKAKESILKNTHDKLNDSFKRKVQLEHELETEKLNKSMMQLELDTFKAIINEVDENRDESDVNVLMQDCRLFTNKIQKLQLEKIKLKQELEMSYDQISNLIANQNKYSEKINLLNTVLNSLKEQVTKLEKEKYLLVKIVQAFIILAKRYIVALEHTKQFKITGFDDIQQLVKEIANVKSEFHLLVARNELQYRVSNDQEKTNSSNQESLEMHLMLAETLEAENNALHKSLNLMNAK